MKSTTNNDDRQWAEMLDYLKRASPTSFDTHFLGSKAVIDGDRLIMTLPDSANLEWIENRQSGIIKQAAKFAYGVSFEIELVKAEAKPIEADELEAEPPKTAIKAKGFTPLVDSLVQDIGLTAASIYGVIWRYCQMNSRTCYASQKTIGDRLCLSRSAINRNIKTLESSGYIRCLNPGAAKEGVSKVYIVTNKVEIEAAFVMDAKINEGV